MGLPLRDTYRHTYGEYLTWPEDVRYELIEGEAYLMAPAPTVGHQRLVLEIARQIADALEGRRCEVFLAPFDVRLPRGDEADAAIDTVVQPDLSVGADPAKIDERGCRGAPDWVIEVLSPATAAHDQTVKLAAYERAGVRECWFVHPTDCTVAVYRLEDRAYGRPIISELAGTLACQAVDAVSIDWARAQRQPAGRTAGSVPAAD
ncbi:MAG TPA: Uma2 family endonuclease [Rhodocyclaceae bacterium]|nr:Uma2 family endonuclease [Rhodocyclaceae bacterium]